MIKRELITALVVALASGLTAVAVVAVLTDGQLAEVGAPADAPGRAPPAPGRAATDGTIAATSRTTAVRAGIEPRTRETFEEERYLVRAGDSLWAIAVCRYLDASAAMNAIKRRNGLQRDTLFAGEVLVLPAAGRTSEGSRANETCPRDEAAVNTPPPVP